MSAAKSRRILFVIPQLWRGGAEKQLTLLASHLDPGEFRVKVVIFYPTGHWLDELRRQGIDVSIIRARSYIRRLWALRREIVSFDPDVVQTFLHSANAYGALSRLFRRFRLVISERGLSPNKSVVQMRFNAAMADRVVVNCRANGERRTRDCGVPPDKLTVIYNGLPALEGNQDSGRHRSAGRVVSVLHLIPAKNVELLLAAVARLRDEIPGLHCRIVGGGRDEEKLRTKASELQLNERVEFTGELTDIPEELRQAALFVLPSRSEGFSNALLEAMQMGLPCIATRIGGNPEMVHDGETGLLVSAEDPAELAAAIRGLLEDPERAERLGRAAAARVAERFSLERMVGEYADLYRELAS